MSRSAWIGVGVFAACLLPAWAMKSVTQQSRVWWIVAVFFFTLAATTFTLIQQTSGRSSQRTPVPHVLHKPYVGLLVGLAFLFAELNAIMFSHAEPGVGFFGKFGLILSQIGSLLFPVVGRYASELGSTISLQALFRTQAIVSIFLLAGVLSTAAIAISLFRMADADRRLLYQQNPRKPPSNTSIAFIIPFAIFVALSGYFGWGEFGEPTEKFCLIEAACFASRDDLTILTASLLKCMGIFGFLLGAFILVDSKRLLPATR